MRRARDLLSAWIRAGLRHKVTTSLVAVAVVAAAIVVPLSLNRPDKRQARPAPLPTAEVPCGPRLIEPPATASTASWQRVSLPPLSTCYRLTATRKDAGGVAVDSTFVLEATGGADTSSLAQRIRSEPPVQFDVEPVEGRRTQYRVKPTSRLRPGTVYRISILSAPDGPVAQRWAFQVQDEVRIVQTLPADEATDVPLNTGIELTFSHDGPTGVVSLFAISPKTDGRFETHDRTVVFVPKALRRYTVYTVTLRPGVKAAGSGKATTAPVTFRFETGGSNRSGETPTIPLQFGRGVWESRTADAPAVGLFGEELPRTVAIRVYRLPNVDEFVRSLGRFTSIPSWASASRISYRATTSGYPLALSFNGSVGRLGDSGDGYVIFPSRLAAGYYLVQAQTAAGPIQTWLQVTDVATYVATSELRTLVWVNDLAAKAPLAGATVRVAGATFSTSTGSDGVALFGTPASLLTLEPGALGSEADTAGNLVITARDGRTGVVPLSDIFTGFREFDYREYQFAGNPAPYWRFVYTDRHLYHPDDTLNFWGLVRAREKPLQEQALDVRVIDYNSGTEAVVASTTVRTSKRGTFIGKTELRDLTAGYYSLQVGIGDRMITSTSFEVRDFVKPPYKIDVTPSKRAVFAGERVAVGVNASFFEGTPVANLRLGYDGAVEGRVSTAADGTARIAFTAARGSEYGIFDTSFLSVAPVLAEEAEISAQALVQVFNSAVMIEAASALASGRATISGTVFNVDLSKLNADRASDPYDFKAGPAAGRRVTANVEEISYRRVETGSEYDFVSKRVTKTYRYDEVSRPAGTFTATSDRRGRFTISFPARSDRQYSAKLAVADARGRVFREDVYVYQFDANDVSPSLVPSGQGPFAPGERISVTLRKGPSDLPSGGANRYLFIQARNGIREHVVRTVPAYAFTFTEAHLPNTDVVGVRFTGTSFEETSAPFSAELDRTLRALTVRVTPRKRGYRPGETAVLDVRVSDRSGSGVSGAEVLLSSVDEAIFRLQEHEFYSDLSILDTLYERVPGGVLRTRASHKTPVAFRGGEHGGEGGVRDTFRDTALFDRVTTGGDGRAAVRFKLPDNLTSWRVSALAVTDGLSAGSGVGAVRVSLPMIADVALNTTYLSSDRPSLRVRAFGTALKPGDAVRFTVSAPTLPVKKATASGRAFEAVDVPLGALREGTHEITVEAKSGASSDALKRTITVVPSRLVRTTAGFLDVRPGDDVEVKGSPDRRTRVVFTDHNRGRYYGPLVELSATYGDRLDQMLARNIAQEMLASSFAEAPALPAVFVPSTYQTDDGGLAIFPYADDDLAMSAHAAMVAPDRFGRAELARYFTSVLGNDKETRERKIIALSGLAAIGEPVLAEVQRLAERDGLSVRERVHVGLAAAALGDDETAAEIYRGVLADYGEVRGDAVRIKSGNTADSILESTSLEALLGAWIGDDHAPLLFNYTVRTRSRDVLTVLEQVGYLLRALPRLPSDAVTFSYLLGGKRHEATVERDQVVALSLMPAELRGLDLKVTRGTLGVATSYLSPVDRSTLRRDTAVGVTRTYETGARRSGVVLREGDLVKIRIDYVLPSTAEDGCYQISDLLPSGLKPVMNLYARGIDDAAATYPYAVEGQRVSFCVAKGEKYRPVVYYARVIGTGRYTAEPAFIQAEAAPESINLTTSVRVDIR